MMRVASPFVQNAVHRLGHSIRAEMGNFSQAPKFWIDDGFRLPLIPDAAILAAQRLRSFLSELRTSGQQPRIWPAWTLTPSPTLAEPEA